MARRSYLQRIAQPLLAGDPVLFAIPRAPSADPHTAAEASAPRAASAKPLVPVPQATSRIAAAADVGPSHQLLAPAPAPDEVAVEAATPALPERAILPNALVPPSVAAPATRDRAPATRGTKTPPTTAARATPGAPAPQVPRATVTVVRPPSANSSIAAPRIHIGTVEVRSHTPTPAARAVTPGARRADAAPISRGYAWHFGLIQR